MRTASAYASTTAVVAGVDGRGVAEPAVLGDQHRRPSTRVLDAVGADQPEHRHQLLLHQRVRGQRGEVVGQRREQDLGRRARRVNPARAASSGACCPSAARLTVSPPPNAKSASASTCSGVSRCAPIRCELADHLVVHLGVDDAGLLGRADHRGVERLGDQDVDDGARAGRRVLWM